MARQRICRDRLLSRSAQRGRWHPRWSTSARVHTCTGACAPIPKRGRRIAILCWSILKGLVGR